MNNDREEYEKMMITLSIVLKDDDKALTGKLLMKYTTQNLVLAIRKRKNIKEENADYKEFADEKQEAQRKRGRVKERHNLNMRTLIRDKKYAVHQGKLISLRRKAKTADNLFVEPVAKLI
eukprot:14607641-Heterocapsa_arctica.AAC.1